jgi:hypothetical protein
VVYFTHSSQFFLSVSMPTARKTKSVTPIRRFKSSASHVVPVVQPARHHNLCQSCHALPAGSMELMALMLVLVFSLSAVLFTSVYALRVQQAKVQTLTTQLQ